MSFGKTLRELRKAKKLTIKELSEKSDISISYITMLENDYYKKPPASGTAETLENVLGAKKDQLVSYTLTKSTISILKDINANPKNAEKLQTVLKEVHKDSGLLNKFLKLLNTNKK